MPYAKWLDLLEADLADTSRTEVEAATANPALRLMDMFRPFRYGPADKEEAREAMGVPKLQTEKAVAAAKALRRENLAPLGRLDALRWLDYWQKAGFLKTKEFAPVPEESEPNIAVQLVTDLVSRIAVPALAALIFTTVLKVI